jgi:hypothetical protein
MKPIERDMSAAGITARLLAIGADRRAKPKPAKVVRPVEMSADAAEAADANPRDVKIATKRADGVSRIERVNVITVEATTRELEAKGLAFAKPEYYQRLDEALRYQPDKGSVTHAYDPFAAERE